MPAADSVQQASRRGSASRSSPALANASAHSPRKPQPPHATPSAGTTPTLAVMHFGVLERDKCLIAKHFSYAYAHVAKLASGSSPTSRLAPHPPSSNGSTSSGTTPGRARAASLLSESTNATAGPHASPPAACCPYFLQLTPSTREKERCSTRSGRVLSESESLQAKHAEEYNFIIPVVSHALCDTIAEHEAIRDSLKAAKARLGGLTPSSGRHRRETSAGGKEGGNAQDDLSDADDAYEMDGRDDEDEDLGSYSDDDETSDDDDSDVEETASRASRRERRLRRKRRGALCCGPPVLAPFYDAAGAAMPPPDFLKRIVKYSFSSPSSLVGACFYMDKLLLRHPSLLLTNENYFLLLLLATRIASKFFDTRSLNNKDFSLVGGISNTQMNALEVTFLEALGCELYISPEEFYTYSADLINAARGLAPGAPVPLPPSLRPNPPAAEEKPATAITTPITTTPSAAAAAEDATPSPPHNRMVTTAKANGPTTTTTRLDTRVLRGSRRPSLVGNVTTANINNLTRALGNSAGAGVAAATANFERRGRSLSIMSTNSQSGVLLPFLRSASRPALPPSDSVSDLNSIRNGHLCMDESASVVGGAGNHVVNVSTESDFLLGINGRPVTRVLPLTNDDVNVSSSDGGRADGDRSADHHPSHSQASRATAGGGKGLANSVHQGGGRSRASSIVHGNHSHRGSPHAARDDADTPLTTQPPSEHGGWEGEAKHPRATPTNHVADLAARPAPPPPQPPSGALPASQAAAPRRASLARALDEVPATSTAKEEDVPLVLLEGGPLPKATAGPRVRSSQYARSSAGRHAPLVHPHPEDAPVALNGAALAGAPSAGAGAQPQPPTPTLNTTYRSLRPAAAQRTSGVTAGTGTGTATSSRVGSANRHSRSSSGGGSGSSWQNLHSTAATARFVSNTRANLLHQQQQLLKQANAEAEWTTSSRNASFASGLGTGPVAQGSAEMVSSDRLQYIPSTSTVSETNR